MQRWHRGVKRQYWALFYAVNVLHAFDNILNALMGGNRFETVSGRLGKGIVQGSRTCVLLSLPIELLFWLLRVDAFGDHCISTAYWELYEHHQELHKNQRSYEQFKRGVTDEQD